MKLGNFHPQTFWVAERRAVIGPRLSPSALSLVDTPSKAFQMTDETEWGRFSIFCLSLSFFFHRLPAGAKKGVFYRQPYALFFAFRRRYREAQAETSKIGACSAAWRNGDNSSGEACYIDGITDDYHCISSIDKGT